MGSSRGRRIYLVSAMDDGRWSVKAGKLAPRFFSTQLEAEDYAIGLALRAIPSVVRVQFRDGTVQREIRYEQSAAEQSH
ncbi:MAG TPA: DUF2188 domain-containing protein [Burkholderiales bacterium]|nr:DUF2188 domain-containing protein [Burkholderiales bacterium]